MSKAIKITANKAPEVYDLGASKFFGTPTVPQIWEDDFCDDEIFFCQIRLSDTATLDTENKLPHTGYLYVFLHTEDGSCRLRPDVRYYNGEPETALEDFNVAVEGYERFTEAWLMEFASVDRDYDGTKLFGVPSDWNYEDEPPELLMQYDPLDSGTGFLDSLDGYLYLFFGKDVADFSDIVLKEEYS